MTEIAEPRTTRLISGAPTVSALAVPLAACLVTIAAVLPVLLSAPASTRRIAVPVFLVGVGVSFGLGLSNLAAAREPRFARLLIGAGVLWSLSALAVSRNPTLYSIGRVSQWLVEYAIVYLLLSYPSGRLKGKADRALIGAGALVLGLLYLPTALVAPRFSSPFAWSACTTGCPSNVLALTHSAPGLVPGLVVSLRQALALALFVAVAVVLTQRGRNSGPLLRRMYAPVSSVAIFRAVLLAVSVLTGSAAPTSPNLKVMGWVYALSLPAVGLACGAGWLYRRLFAAKALDRIAHGLGPSATAPQVRRTLADALEDPSLRILHWFPGDTAWLEESGSPAVLPPESPEQGVTEVASAGWRIAIVHDLALGEAPEVVEAAGVCGLSALENDHLSDELRSSRRELAESRALRVTAEQRERRKIERDIHDGAQQRLVALRVKLALAAEQLGGQDSASADALHALEDDVDATIDEVRSFARGIYPSLLAETGLRDALRAVGRASALPVTVHAEALRRYPREIETTVYFSCSEALQNAAKHASSATRVTIWAWEDGELHFEVRDDGAGFQPQSTRYGAGLSNLRDRLAAVGGRARIRSAAGRGTQVGGSIPIG